MTEELTSGSKEALKQLMFEECKKYGILPKYYEELSNNDYVSLYKELGIRRIVTPNFINYFTGYDWKRTKFTEFDKLKTIEDPKFSTLSGDYSIIKMCDSIIRLFFTTYNIRILRLSMELSSLGLKPLTKEFNKTELEMLYKIRSLSVEYEMNHDIGVDYGNIHIIKEGDNYRILSGNHRVLAYLTYARNVNLKDVSMNVWLGEKISGVATDGVH